MAYTTINKSSENFNTKLYTGNGGTQSLTGVGFQPDFTWVKGRSVAEHNNLYDAVRGVTKPIYTNLTYGEGSASDSLTAFNSDGFSIGANAYINTNSATFASWNWKANGAGSSNTDGSITSTVSANTTAGFSIVKFTGTGANATVGHGLGSVPKFIFGKNTNSGSSAWPIYSSVLGGTKYLNLNTTSAEGTFSGYWNNTNPTSSVISVGSHGDVNNSGDSIIYYCFAEKKGYSKFGKYVGNSSNDGVFIYTGFKPSLVIIKVIDGTGNWQMFDNKRIGYNPLNYFLFPHLSNAEDTSNPQWLDLHSNGFKLRNTGTDTNSSSNTYIYMAIGQSLVGTNNVPCTAR